LAPSSSEGARPLIAHRMEKLRAGLDSLAHAHQGRLVVETLFEEGDVFGGEERMISGAAAPGPQESPAPRAVLRFGAPHEAAARLLRALDADGGRGGRGGREDIHAFMPVFARHDLAALAPAARAWLE